MHIRTVRWQKHDAQVAEHPDHSSFLCPSNEALDQASYYTSITTAPLACAKPLDSSLGSLSTASAPAALTIAAPGTLRRTSPSAARAAGAAPRAAPAPPGDADLGPAAVAVAAAAAPPSKMSVRL